MSDDAVILPVVAKPARAKKEKVKVPFVSAPATFPDDLPALAVIQPHVAPVAAPEPAPEPKSVTEEVVMDTVNTAETVVENTAETVGAKGQAFFADATARAKNAAEKGAKLFEDMNAFNKGNLEALVESSKIAAKGAETLGQSAADYARRSFEAQTAAFKSFAGVKSPTEFMKLHSDYVRQSFDAMVAETSRSTEAALKLAGEIAQPLSSRFAVAAEKLKVAA